jgi:hypothetical protein
VVGKYILLPISLLHSFWLPILYWSSDNPISQFVDLQSTPSKLNPRSSSSTSCLMNTRSQENVVASVSKQNGTELNTTSIFPKSHMEHFDDTSKTGLFKWETR